jgi:ABC-type nickel/cobalt efflux system permease component RcnA
MRGTKSTRGECLLQRRLFLSIATVISQILLIALAVAWFVHMVLIELYGSVYFVERVPAILWTEIVSTILIVIFAFFVLVLQIKRLGERRGNDRIAEPIRDKDVGPKRYRGASN